MYKQMVHLNDFLCRSIVGIILAELPVLCCDQICVNSVNPTVVMTEMGRLGWSDPEKATAMTSRIPLGRFAGQTQQAVCMHGLQIYFFME